MAHRLRDGDRAVSIRLVRTGMASSSGLPDRPLTAESFLRGVLRSGLLERDDLQASLRGVPREQRDDAQALAECLVRKGKLTRFQAGKLLRGISQGMILGPFRLLTPIGRGGMGTVFLVRDTRSDQMVALKILPPKLARTEHRMLARFHREMELSQKVSHTHLAWTYEVGEFRGVPYIAMEYIPGRTLSRVVAEDGPLPYPRAARLMAEVASALDHAHEQGLIHRDLKPGNILITPRDRVKVVDLGLALIHGETVEDAMVVGGQGYIVGTMDYIAPEQTLDAAAVDRRSDLYSLGCTLYYAITGQPPFPGGTSKEKIQRHRREQPTPIQVLVPHLPAGFVALIERLMDKDPARRYSTAAEVESQLRAWAGSATDLGNEEENETLAEVDLIHQSQPSTDFSLVNLPSVEADSGEEPTQEASSGLRSWSPNLVAMLAASACLLLLVISAVVMILLFARR
ncbi:MAG: serine/threonine-protein kinase [Gemmataceae bacterium]